MCFVETLQTTKCKHYKGWGIRVNEANRVYEAQCVEVKQQRTAKTEHKPPFADGGIEKLYRCGIIIQY